MLLATAGCLYLASRVNGLWSGALWADPTGDKLCPSLLDQAPEQAATALPARFEALPPEPRWLQRGGSIDDVSCLDRVPIQGIVEVRTEADVGAALAYARASGHKVSVAGLRHSMGGQAFARGGIVLDMRRFNQITVDADRRTMRVQSGATWHAIQARLHPRFAVRAMQSTDIFTVGGSISVNAHGMDHQAGAMARSIRAMRVMLADGSVLQMTPGSHPDLFNHVIGGYGLFGVILEAELEVADNPVYRTERRHVGYRDFPALFAREIEPDRSIGLLYTHLSTAPSSFLQETIVYTYSETGGSSDTAPLDEVGATRLRRLMLNLAKGPAVFKEAKWLAEKHLEPRFESCTVSRAQAMSAAEGCFVSRNNPMHDSVHYLRNRLPNDTDVLQEYFVPRERLIPFIDGLRRILIQNRANLLNASIRVVDEETNALSYARAPSFSVVLYLNQTTDRAGNERMHRLTGQLIDLAGSQRGTFFLPYQMHYTTEQLVRAYPMLPAVFAAKRRYDPDELLVNSFYRRFAAALSAR